MNFGYWILDWIPVAEYETVKRNVSYNYLFPLSVPLPMSFQIVIKGFCMPPFVSLHGASEKYEMYS